jgi:hypothetical protein
LSRDKGGQSWVAGRVYVDAEFVGQLAGLCDRSNLRCRLCVPAENPIATKEAAPDVGAESTPPVKVGETEKKVLETIIEIRKVFTNKKWCTWADARLSGADRTAASAESPAKDFG